MALNSMFFERVLQEVGRVTKKMEEHGDINIEELCYQEGKAFLCFQIYRQNIRNPRLLEISEKRIKDIKALKEKYAEANGDGTIDDEEIELDSDIIVATSENLELEIEDEGSDTEDIAKDDVSGDEPEVVEEVSLEDIITPVVEDDAPKIKTLTAEEINSMKSNELKVEVNLRGIILEKYNVEPMREALLELIK